MSENKSSSQDPEQKMDVDNDDDEIAPEILEMSAEQIRERTMLLDNEVRIMRSEIQRINHSVQTLKEKVKENNERVKVNKQLPYLVSNVIELLDLEDQQEDEGANVDLDARKTKCAVIKTSTRATYFLPVIGLVDTAELKPGDLVGVNKDSYLVLEKLPPEYDSRVKAMEVDERPTETYTDIGGCDSQIKELIEAIVLPMTKKEIFANIGILPPKGVLMYGPPGTGKTMLARAVAAQTKSAFLKLAGPQLVQMFIGDGAKLVRDAFALAKEKAPAIIFIDELDAIGTKRFNSEKAGDREVQRTMLELLNQLDGFQPNDDVKVIAATNRVDVLDPALLRSGRLDRKIELPAPNEKARARILQLHARKMNVSKEVNYDELARCTDDFNGAQCKAVCVESGMIALRRDATIVEHEDFMDAILEVQAKKKTMLTASSSSQFYDERTGRDSQNNQKLHIIEWQHMDLYKFYPLAFIASSTVRALFYPLNLVKSRLQLQRQNNVYNGMRHAFSTVYKKEGFSALYRGFWITLPQIGASFIYSTIYEKARSVLHLKANIESPLLVSALAGGIASVSAQFIFVPTDVISQHMMIYNNPKQFLGSSLNKAAIINLLSTDGHTKNIGSIRNYFASSLLGLRVARAVHKADGITGFYRGFFSSLLLYLPHSMCFWSAYYTWLGFFKQKFGFTSKEEEYSFERFHSLLVLQSISGALGGLQQLFVLINTDFSSKPTIYFKRIFFTLKQILVHRTGYLETIKRLYSEEGKNVFTKGLAPRMINNGLQSFCVITGYEAIKRLCVLPEYKNYFFEID
ncbi:26S proteasome subunit P45 family protein [Meloidogyne graminicola]|uniref:26S proteasome subunit P45 family protein n=1 Tax=Meloidogyne graminicola TaxID=189291 RepID=A0A8T0A360_9BILA|nr:26S proteasome subunit P45 family protein [Meloidogyne graminicola]